MQHFPIIVLILSSWCSQSIGSSNTTRADQVAPSRAKRSSTAPILETGPTVSSAIKKRNQNPIQYCSEIRQTDYAVIQPLDENPPFWASCVQHHRETGDGWLVIQQRKFTRLSFNRNWIEYREGFGDLDGEFWLGLENIYRLTSLERYELLIDLAFKEGATGFARFSRFEIASEKENYALIQLGSYTGTAGDSLVLHVGMAFSTFDNDNDLGTTINCAVNRKSGWWFDNCVRGGNLNGVAISYKSFDPKWAPIDYCRMMLRRIL